MAIKKAAEARQAKKREKGQTEPKFPYTTKPSSLRRLLQDIPKKPKPPKINAALLRSWGFTDTNDQSMIRVLKAVGLLNSNSEPNELYARFMHLDGGAAVLADPIRRIYEPLFNASHAPYRESNEMLQNLFNIHSGGGERALDQQIQTFKALCESTSFDGLGPVGEGAAREVKAVLSAPASPQGFVAPTVQINLHIHLPENKARRDYEAIIEDIGRYIFGRSRSGDNHEQ